MDSRDIQEIKMMEFSCRGEGGKAMGGFCTWEEGGATHWDTRRAGVAGNTERLQMAILNRLEGMNIYGSEVESGWEIH